MNSTEVEAQTLVCPGSQGHSAVFNSCTSFSLLPFLESQVSSFKWVVSSHDKSKGLKRSAKEVTFMVSCWYQKTELAKRWPALFYSYPSLGSMHSDHERVTLQSAGATRSHVNKSTRDQPGKDKLCSLSSRKFLEVTGISFNHLPKPSSPPN